MFIDNETQKRVNIYAEYKGFSRLDTPEIRLAAGVVEIPDPTPPEDYSDDMYYRTEQDDAPYVVWTRKSDEQIKEMINGRIKAQIASLESKQDRAIREAVLTGDKTRLEQIDVEIYALRAQL